MRSSREREFRRRLAASRHLRVSWTASNVLVSIDNSERVDDPDGGQPHQQVDAVKGGFTLHVDHVPEIPTDEKIGAGQCGGRHVPCIVLVLTTPCATYAEARRSMSSVRSKTPAGSNVVSNRSRTLLGAGTSSSAVSREVTKRHRPSSIWRQNSLVGCIHSSSK